MEELPKNFLKAFSDLIKENTIDRFDTEINFIGDVLYAEGESVKNLIKSFNLEDCVTIRERIPYKESLFAMKKSHVLLLFAPDQVLLYPCESFRIFKGEEEDTYVSPKMGRPQI